MGVCGSRKARARAIVLLSGGLDSSACLSLLLDRGFAASALFIDYQQLSAAKEHRAAHRISSHYRVGLRKLTYRGLGTWSEGFIPARNALLLIGGLMAFRSETGVVAIGIHTGTSYTDCTPTFVRTMQLVFDLYTDGRVRISAPFLRWSKRQIWDYCRTNSVPVGLTYSCEMGRRQPCGGCNSCRDLEALRGSGAE
jgi:7-cyano-7-deazaguanine synthase